MPTTKPHSFIPRDVVERIEEIAGINEARAIYLTELAQKLADEGLL